ncbi:MAG: hypothetical protein DUW69_002588, partial [Verrucomicrobia bacterium]
MWGCGAHAVPVQRGVTSEITDSAVLLQGGIADPAWFGWV